MKTLQDLLQIVKDSLIETRIKLQTIKIYRVLSGDWWEDLEVDNKGNYNYESTDGETLVIKTNRVKVYF